jgi:hypothetical protein
LPAISIPFPFPIADEFSFPVTDEFSFAIADEFSFAIADDFSFAIADEFSFPITVTNSFTNRNGVLHVERSAFCSTGLPDAWPSFCLGFNASPFNMSIQRISCVSAFSTAHNAVRNNPHFVGRLRPK